ncbi:hypothetical protein PUNSTDRAFT_130490 [Punctularia strigosozonata HHB-11173 SS5]|uniref:uncharacterized protein n=1 Tax=Punctularia strigosozonata (strain HHB-11173) TaxID=741275 RepID=UPI0004417FBE|nr:uncharacterized protein PUNSTDRAFT_130490 [Punctularia strigosozonata HHB-11173 SS5]EIN12220.1 hypothetical protein PUNSTDRAFT_130490 [Punctularia strigosozonata HHB-11173 SS5]
MNTKANTSLDDKDTILAGGYKDIGNVFPRDVAPHIIYAIMAENVQLRAENARLKEENEGMQVTLKHWDHNLAMWIRY